MDNFFGEMKRRNVFRVAGVYAVVGWVLAQIATTLEETMSLPEWFDGLIVAMLLIGFPIAIVIAWAFELTPQGVVRTEDVPEGESITAETGHKLDYAIVAGLVLLAAMIIWQQSDAPIELAKEFPVVVVDEPAAAEIDAASIAVLPFADLSPGGDQEYFSDGISEEILNVLVGVAGLDVTSRTSSFQFKDAGIGIPEIAAALNVRHVVEGSVRKSGETIRVTAQLIDSINDKHLWSDTYDRPLTTENIFEIQDDIANSIVEALSTVLGVGSLEPIQVSATTRNLTAYELFLQARPLFLARQDLDTADSLLERAIEQDPEYAKAWEIRAALQSLQVEYGYSSESSNVAEARGDEFARRALQIDPRSATALAVLAKSAANANEDLRKKADIAEMIAALDRALEIEPRNASALTWRGLRFVLLGELEKALADFDACIRYEPYYEPCVENQYAVLAALGRDEEALDAFGAALDNSTAKLFYAHLPLLARMNEELAFKSAANDPTLLDGWREHKALYQAYRNPDEDHSELIKSIRAHMRAKGNSAIDMEWIVLPIGGVVRVPDPLMLWDKSAQQYRQTHEFKWYMREVGALDYWREFGFPPQCRPVGGDDFECD